MLTMVFGVVKERWHYLFRNKTTSFKAK